MNSGRPQINLSVNPLDISKEGDAKEIEATIVEDIAVNRN